MQSEKLLNDLKKAKVQKLKGQAARKQDIRLRDVIFGIAKVDKFVAKKQQAFKKKAFKQTFKNQDTLLNMLRAEEQKNRNLSKRLESIIRDERSEQADAFLDLQDTPRKVTEKKPNLIVIESPDRYEPNPIMEFESFSKENTTRKSRSSRNFEE